MSKYTDRIDAFENNEKRKRRSFTIIIVVLVLIFLGGMVLGARSILGNEGTFDPYAETASVPLLIDKSAEEILGDLKTSVNSANDKTKVKMSVYTDLEIPDDTIIVASGDEKLVSELKYIKSSILAEVKNYYGQYEGKFGDDLTKETVNMNFTADDIKSFECAKGRLDDEGNLQSFDTLYYKVTFPEVDFKAVENTVLFNNFDMDVSENVRDTFINDILEIADVKNIDIRCSEFGITSEINAETGRINNICYTRGYHIDLTLTFKGDLKDLGTETISFTLYAKQSHWYTWAGLSLNADTLSIEKGDVEALQATKTTDDEVEVTWTSSNPEVAEVDEKGYVKGKSLSAEPVTITAVFEYLGSTYTDTCTVYVRKPVEEILVSEKELNLTIGDTRTLEVKISPKKATIQKILWFSEDDSIATVDENGTITAKKSGSTGIYAISADGYFRSTCRVTVTESKGEEVNG